MGSNWAFKNEQNLETHKGEKKIFQFKRKQHEQRHLEGRGQWGDWRGTGVHTGKVHDLAPACFSDSIACISFPHSLWSSPSWLISVPASGLCASHSLCLDYSFLDLGKAATSLHSDISANVNCYQHPVLKSCLVFPWHFTQLETFLINLIYLYHWKISSTAAEITFAFLITYH